MRHGVVVISFFGSRITRLPYYYVHDPMEVWSYDVFEKMVPAFGDGCLCRIVLFAVKRNLTFREGWRGGSLRLGPPPRKSLVSLGETNVSHLVHQEPLEIYRETLRSCLSAMAFATQCMQSIWYM